MRGPYLWQVNRYNGPQVWRVPRVVRKQNVPRRRRVKPTSNLCLCAAGKKAWNVHQITKTFDRNEELEEEITAKATINELLEDEHTTDVEQLLQWAADMDAHEEDLMELLKYQVKTSFVVYKKSI